MADKTIGFIGGGRVTRILIGGWAKAGTLAQQVVVADPDPVVLEHLSQAYPHIHTVANATNEAAAQDVVFLAVHPPTIATVLAEVRGTLRSDSVLVSLAPKLTIERLADMLDGFVRIARMIPNAPSIVGAGFNPITFCQQLPPAEQDMLQDLFAPLGTCPIVAEDKLEAYAIITAMSPTYFWPQLYALEALAESFGLSAAAAEEAIRQAMFGTLATMFDSGLERAAVEDLISVKPLAEPIATVTEEYRTRLTALMEKIRP